MSSNRSSSLWQQVVAPFKRSLRFKLAVGVFSALVILAAGTIGLNYADGMKRQTIQVEQSFTVLTKILANDITRWLTNRETDVISMAANPLVRQYVLEMSTGSTNVARTGEEIERYWADIRGQYRIYDEIYLVNPFGQILLSTEPERRRTFRPVDDLITTPLETGRIYFKDAYFSFYTGKPCIAFAMPLGVPSGDREGSLDYTAMLVYRVNIKEVLHSLLETGVNLGETGEVILIDQNRTVITELRGQPGSALNYVLQSEPALRVVRGEEGVLHVLGYNDAEILAAYRYLPNVRWGLIVRQESSELFSPLKVQMVRSVYANVLAAFLTLGVIYLLLGRIFRPVQSMAEVAGLIAQGDFSRRVNATSEDEIGVLGNTLDSMADQLDLQYKMQKCREDVLKTLVSTLDVDELLTRVLAKVCRSFDFHVGAAFLTDPEKGTLVRKAVYCPSGELLSRNEVIRFGEGLEGLAVTTRQVRVLTDLPEETVYTVNWLGGHMLPGSIVQVPLLFGKETMGVLSLASLHKTDEQKVQEISNIGSLMGVAIHNALSHRRTQELSERLQELNEQLVQQNEELNAQSEELTSQTEELMSQTEELQAQSEELQAQSEELQAVTQELKRKNLELERAGDRRLKFLASLSHELRAPLNAVISFSDVLLDRVVGEVNPQQEKYLQEIFNSGQHLLQLINDLLDLSKIEAGQIQLNIREIDPAIPLEEALAMVSAEVARKRLEVEDLVPRDRYTVTADRDRLRQVFLNLLTNAVKFTPEGGHITIGARTGREETLYLWVSDTGIGISPEYHEVIFEEFKQVAASPDAPGTGLGLAITKRLLSLQGGNIYVQSGQGQGATFTFTLPAVMNGVGTAAAEPFECNLVCPARGNCADCDCPRATVVYLRKPLHKTVLMQNMKRATCQLVGEALTVLVVDDDPAVTTYVASIMRPRGYRVVTARDGRKGIEEAIRTKPDIVILDIVMPEVDGFAVLDRLSQEYWEKGLSVLVCTSKDLSVEEQQYLESRVKAIQAKRRPKPRDH